MATCLCLRVPRACSSGVAPTVSTLKWGCYDGFTTLPLGTCWQCGSYRGCSLHPMCIPSCGLDHTPGPSGCLSAAKPSPFPGSGYSNLSFRTQALGTPADMCLGLGSQWGGKDLLCCSLSILPTALPSDPPNLSQLTSQPEEEISSLRGCFSFHNSLPGMGSHFNSCFFPTSSYPVTWSSLSCSPGCMRSSANI